MCMLIPARRPNTRKCKGYNCGKIIFGSNPCECGFVTKILKHG